jgi:hypothetical protein
VCVAVALSGATAGCARPGNTPAGTPETSVTLFASAAPIPRGQASLRAEIARAPTGTCGTAGGVARAPGAASARPFRAAPVPRQPNAAPRTGAPSAAAPATAASRPDGTESVEERTRRVLEAQRSAIPRRGNVPADAAARAADCVVILRMELTLRRASGTLDENAVRAALTAARLTRVVVGPGLRFAGSTGQACVVGSVPAGGSGAGAVGDTGNPEIAIAPLRPDGTCQP